MGRKGEPTGQRDGGEVVKTTGYDQTLVGVGCRGMEPSTLPREGRWCHVNSEGQQRHAGLINAKLSLAARPPVPAPYH
ncbi:Hypothetical protein NTJ_03383 [Nesidiocoris tenuis]|uniref:Uncharacterized protein n=1 Tax=Nesidiocoris tenuis TaxID=355587 RepID=A0ABN7AGT4_9HEMI|nr:Hypothetical protein NTJ_03383 [Nesidiocoris tenuis]